MKVLIDTNVILDVMLEREPFVDISQKAFQLALQSNFKPFLTATTITDLYYIVRKAKGASIAIQLIERMVQLVDIAAVNKHVILQALQSPLTDFEDAIQASSASHEEIHLLITRNVADFHHSSLEIYTPQSFLAKFS